MARPAPRLTRVLRPPALDRALAVVLALATLGALLSDDGAREIVPEPAATPLGVALALAATLPLAWRRRWPLEVLVVLTAANAAYIALRFPDGPSALAVLVAVFGVASAMPVRRSLPGAGIAAVGGAIPALTRGSIAEAIGNAVFWIVLCVAAWSLGAQIRNRRQRRAALAERAQREERERELMAERRVAEERLRIARELHDVVAHGVSVMVVQAGAARTVLDTDPERAEGALRAVEETGRTALTEMRRLLGLLRAGTGEQAGLAPVPALDDIPELVRASEAAGVPTSLKVRGTPGTLAPAVGLAAYRIVQEALTNVRRHAGPGARATILVEYGPEEVRVLVDDDGVGPAGEVDPGHGLVGMRERASALGGEVEVASRPGGGMRVAARLPVSEAAVA